MHLWPSYFAWGVFAFAATQVNVSEGPTKNQEANSNQEAAKNQVLAKNQELAKNQMLAKNQELVMEVDVALPGAFEQCLEIDLLI